MKKSLAITLLSLSLFAPPATAQEPVSIPKLINYQGKLVQANGVDPLQAGSYTLRFKLFDGATGGTLVWGESQQVAVTGGVFNVILGAAGSIPVQGAAVNDLGFAFGGAERFLETTIVSGPDVAMEKTLAPRQQLTTVPYAVQAQDASHAKNSERLAGEAPSFWIPSGSVVAYGGLSDPPGWLICDGRELGREDYADLFESIGVTYGAGNGVSTFNIPDARGLVLRGAGQNLVNGRQKDGPLLGQKQEDQIQNFTGEARVVDHGGSSLGIWSSTSGVFGRSTLGSTKAEQTGGTAEPRYESRINIDASRSARAGLETRVAALGVNYIIKK